MSFYGLIIGVAIVIGLNYFRKHHPLVSPKHLTPLSIITLISAIIGARLYHVFSEWTYYSQHLSQIPATWNGGLGIFGGLIGALIPISLYCLFYRVSYIVFLDSIIPILPLCQALGRLGNFANHEIPLWWTEALANLTLFFIIRFFPRHPTAKYFIGYGLIRFIFEIYRSDTWSINSIKIGQIIAIIFIATGTYLWKTAIPSTPSSPPSKP